MAPSSSITLGLAVHEGFPFSPNHFSPRESVLSVSLARSPPRAQSTRAFETLYKVTNFLSAAVLALIRHHVPVR